MTIGILGMGAGQSLLSAILRSKLARLGRIRDRREEITAGMLQRFNLPPEAFTPDYQVMLDDPEIDIIGIYTPDSLHASTSRKRRLD
jgi:predicted dehydrogenase